MPTFKEKRWLLLGVLTALVLVLLCVGELVLRGFGIGVDTRYWLPSSRPGIVHTNPAWYRPWFPRGCEPDPVIEYVRKEKPENTTRILWVGGTGSSGRIFSMQNPARYLQAALTIANPGSAFEVIQVGAEGGGHVLAGEVVRQSLVLAPDLVILALGHDAAFAPFSPGDPMHAGASSPGAVRWTYFLRRSRVWQAIKGRDPKPSSDPTYTSWEGIARHAVARGELNPSEREAAIRSMEEHIRAILICCRSEDIPVALALPVSDIRGYPPSQRGGTDEERAAWSRVESHLQNASLDKASAIIIPLLEQRPHGAMSHYLHARYLQQSGKTVEAREAFETAVDLDPLPHRFSTAHREALIRLAAEFRAPVSHAPAEIDDTSLLLGHQLLPKAAFVMAREIAGTLSHLPSFAASEKVTQSACDEMMARNEEVLWGETQTLLRRLGHPPFVDQTYWKERSQVLHADLAQRLDHLNGAGARDRIAFEARRAHEAAPNDHALHAQWVRTLIGAGRYPLAEEQLLALYEERPGDPTLRRLQQVLYTKAGSADAAAQALNKQTRWFPHRVNLRIEQGMALQGMGRSLQEISTWFTSLSREFPGNADVWRNMGVVFALQQQPEEALRAFQTALDLRPSDPDTRRAMAEHLVAIKRPNEALRLVQSLREDAPHDPLPLLLSAHVFESLGDYPAAVAFSDKALALSPEHEGVTQARNSLLARRNDLARRIFNEAQELRARGDLRNAVAALDRALVIWPGAVTVLENLAFVLATTPDETLRNGDRALMLIEKRIAMEGSGTFETQATLAAAHAARGDFAQAVTFAEKALEMGKSQPGVNTSRLELALEAYRRSTVWSP